MKASELRIGNLIGWYEPNQELLPVRVIGLSNKIIRASVNFTMQQHNEIHQSWQPIPLTEEWLLKFGFEKFDEMYFIEFGAYSMTIKEYEKGKYIVNYETHFNYVDIEYVHQLQNLYFALTNEELTLNHEN